MASRANSGDDAGPPPSDAGATIGVADAGAEDPVDAQRRLALLGQPLSGRSLGHTSVVFKLRLSTETSWVWKPASRRGPLRFLGEIAAYELGRELALPNVPPAYERTFRRAVVLAALGGESTAAGELFAREAIADGGGDVRGALMPWIEKLTFIPLEAAPLAAMWPEWLKRGGEIPEGPLSVAKDLTIENPKDLARQISVLVAFDFLTANWDRWSGANIGWDAEHHRLLFVDNDGAFYEAPPKDGLLRNARMLGRVDRFSASFVARLRALTDERVERVLSLVSARVRAQIRARRDELLGIVAAKGDEALYFE